MARDVEKKDELFALAKKTPLTRSAVEELAGRASAAALRLHAVASLTEAGSHAATVLAFASIAKGDKLEAAFVRGLLAEVESFDHVGPLLASADRVVDAAAGFLEDRRGTWEREVMALLVAADALKDEAAPKALISRARYLSRHDLGADSAVLLGAAAARLGDADLASLAAPQIAKAKRHKRVVDETLATTRTPPLELLSESAHRVTAGFTVKRDAPSVGRNDPCPCGSGKKYKKCHALESSDAGWQPPALDPTVLGPDQTANMRASELARLDTSLLPKPAWIEAFKRAVDYRQWDVAARMIGEAKAQSPSERDHLVLEALLGAFDASDAEAAARFHAMLPPDLAEDRAFELDCVAKPDDLLEKIEAEARLALREDADGARGMLLASTLLRHLPALGVYVARGALHDGRIRDSEALLQRIEDARDRLLVSPFEPWWDVYDALVDEGGERRDQRKADAKREKLKEDLRRARAASRKTATEVDKLQRRIDELDSTMAAQTQQPKVGQAQPKTQASDDLAGERKRLKTKIDELQRIIGEGQEERRELRKQLADKSDDTDVPVKAAPRDGATAETEEEPHGMHEDEDVEAPRAVLVPRFGDRAARAVEDLAAPSADAILQVVASLAAGKPNAWHGVKQLTKVRGVLSARAGIHHRVLFRIDASALDVVDVLHRKDLEQVVARLARAGDARRS